MEDFNDEGAFPEIYTLQYPLDMGSRKQDYKTSSGGGKTLISFDSIARQSENAKIIVYSQHRDLIPRVLFNHSDDENSMDLDLQKKKKEVEETTVKTKAAIEEIVNVRLNAVQLKNIPAQSSESKFFKYMPSQQLSSGSAAFNSDAKDRMIKMVGMPVDPLDLPKFKHKKILKTSGSSPVPVLHSPPRPLTVKDTQNWKIPPCISNWKNPKGYIIPLDKRLAADGRGLDDLGSNQNHGKLYEALGVAEEKARDAISMRQKIQKDMMMKEKERKEKEFIKLARQARSEKPHAQVEEEAGEERLQREKIREDWRRDRKRKLMLEAKDHGTGKRRKISQDRRRDISEKVALGMANTIGKGETGGEVMYDQRLFNQEKGMDSGFATDDSYNIYDKRLFTAASTVYRPKKAFDCDTCGGGDEQLEKIMKTERFKPDKAFSGTSETFGPRGSPVDFDKEDVFGLDQLLVDMFKGEKTAR